MRLSLWPLLLVSIILPARDPRTPQDLAADPERLLTDRFGLSAAELEQARAGQPVARMLTAGSRDELAVIGVVKLTGDKTRLADWIRNIGHFRGSAELGTAYAIPSAVTEAAFAPLVLDAADLTTLQKCRADKCDIRLSPATLGEFQQNVPWGTSDAPARASQIARRTLAGLAQAYQERGRAGIDALAGQQGVLSTAADIRMLFDRATTLGELSPDLVGYLERYPAPAPAGLDQSLYWSMMPADSVSIIALHHLVVYKPRPEQVLITDQTVYATRYFDAGVVVISLADAPGGGYYAIAGGRILSAQLGRAAAVVLRRQIEKAALESLRTYLAWVRDSLNS
jgi:hypothetical protein